MNYLVDTNVLSELARPQPAGEVMDWFVKHESHLYVSSISLGEIRKGLELLPRGKRRAGLHVWFKAVCDRMDGRVLSFNTSTAHVWGQLVESLEKKGVHIPTVDGQLAATAQRHGLIMVTRNIADFKNAGVKVFNPFGG